LVPPGDQKERRATPLHALPEVVTADALGEADIQKNCTSFV